MANKYDPLYDHLRSLSGNTWSTSFVEIERVLEGMLPKSARTHRAWWSNEEDGDHVQAHAWLGAGWQVTDVDLSAGTVRFGRRR